MTTGDEVELKLPDILFGKDPRGFLEYIGLKGRPLGNSRWKVKPNNDKSFISHHLLADDTQFTNRFDHLTHIPLNTEKLDDPDIVAGFAELEQQLADRIASGSDIAAVFHRIQADILRCGTHHDLMAIVEEAFGFLRLIPTESTGELLFSHLTVHLAIATKLLLARMRLPAIIFRFEQDPDATKTIAKLGDEGGYFASSSNWFQNVITPSHYFGPLLGCISPGFWCINTGGPPAAILFSLGTSIAGYRQTPMEPMQLLPATGRNEPVPPLELDPTSCRIAITWWTNRLNQMFGYLCDPTLFSTKYGIYDAYEHQHWLLTFGQIFDLMTALQTSSRNHATQRALMNTLLDTFADRVLDRRFDRLCTYDNAKDAAERAREKMPTVVAKLLMPLADRALDSLLRVQDGFFLHKQRGDNNVIVHIPGSERGHHKQPPRAAAMLLKLFRNATHGFGSLRQPDTDEDLVVERLLSHHTGEIPDDLVFLPYLYLLDVLCNPESIRETIVKRARKRN